MKTFFTTTQVAKTYDLTVKQVRNLCNKGLINGAKKVKNVWQIPNYAFIPIRNKAKYTRNKINFEPLFKFIPYFEGGKFPYKRGGGKQKDGTCQMPYIIYDETMSNFVHTFYSLDCSDKNYYDTLEKYNFNSDNNYRDFAVETEPQDLILAILTLCIRRERTCEGVWLDCAKNGIFLAVLKRLNELQS